MNIHLPKHTALLLNLAVLTDITGCMHRMIVKFYLLLSVTSLCCRVTAVT